MLSSQIYANLGNKNAVSAISIVQLSGAECTICAIKCATLFQFLHHKKLEHKESVKRFINNVKYAGLEIPKCWFLHEKKSIHEENKKKEITEKIFSMMETFSNRIVELENQIKNDQK